MTARPPKKTPRSGHLSIIPAAAVFDRRLSHADVRVLAALSTYADKKGRCWPAIPTLANRTGMSERHIRTSLRNLEKLDSVETESRPGQSNMYRIPRKHIAGVPRNQAAGVEPNPGTILPGPRNQAAGDPGTVVPPNDIKNDTNNDYAFSGVVLRLTWQDFSAWQESYKAIPDLRAALQQRDDWLASLPPDDKRRTDWFVPTSNWLAKESGKHVAARSEPAHDSDVIH